MTSKEKRAAQDFWQYGELHEGKFMDEFNVIFATIKDIDGYFEINRDPGMRALLDGNFTPNELRRIADAVEAIAALLDKYGVDRA